MKYLCLNCNNEIKFDENSNYIITCNVCNWRNELNDTPAISPIILLSKTFEDYSVQICYPLLDKSLLTLITDTQREAVEMYLNSPEKLTKKQYDVIYHHIYSKDLSKLSTKLKRLQSKIEIIKFFKSTNFLKRKQNLK